MSDSVHPTRVILVDCSAKREVPVKKQKTFDQAFEGAKRMSDRYVAKGPYKFYSEPDIVEEVQKGLGSNELKHGYRYCP